MKTIKTLALTGALASLTFATASFAQQPQAPGQGPRAGMEGRERPSPEQMRSHMAERLRATLQLTPQQEAALNTYVAAIAPKAGERPDRRGAREAMRDMTTPQRLDAMAAHMAQRQQAFAARAEATKRFYAQLTPSQQKAFDALRPAGRGMGGKGKGKGGPGGPGGNRAMGHGGPGGR
ncbi:Spy/CpxP family protein refolding chaperone [Phenylobacterium sp.]|jgi:hypothetical protein|uniref:Spy/CpxP family protein refolding chaperone n=1 Tax=Phenylobacterium sp. TaxID=1871053 RepID=UPI000C9612FA|nr:Spy/CpxP family protein refolding chaperone [Phenylobacterium sp.]MAK83557.1 hypothetical protein [Phenylobacterium sp.]|tara:strand:+ start:265 stop:798 length:534 start_codon:yes stop_codon:yes gene_type:complete